MWNWDSPSISIETMCFSGRETLAGEIPNVLLKPRNLKLMSIDVFSTPHCRSGVMNSPGRSPSDPIRCVKGLVSMDNPLHELITVKSRFREGVNINLLHTNSILYEEI